MEWSRGGSRIMISWGWDRGSGRILIERPLSGLGGRLFVLLLEKKTGDWQKVEGWRPVSNAMPSFLCEWSTFFDYNYVYVKQTHRSIKETFLESRPSLPSDLLRKELETSRILNDILIFPCWLPLSQKVFSSLPILNSEENSVEWVARGNQLKLGENKSDLCQIVINIAC